MTKGNIIVILFMAIAIGAAITIKVKYGNREIVVNETSETMYRDITDAEKKLRPGSNLDGWKEMEKLCQRLLEKYPDSKEAMYAQLELAGIYSKGYKDYAKTIEKLRFVLKKYPKLSDHEGIYWQLLDATSKIAKETGDKTRALDVYKEYIAEFPKSRKAEQLTYEMGGIYREAGNIDAAIEAYQKIVGDFPQSKNADKALFALAEIQLSKGNNDDAKHLLSRIIEAYPKSVLTEATKKKLEELGVPSVKPALADYNKEHYGIAYPYHYFVWGLDYGKLDLSTRYSKQKIDIQRYDLIVRVMPDAKSLCVSGKISLTNNGETTSEIALLLNGKFGKFMVNAGGESLEFEHKNGLLVIKIPQPLENGKTLELNFESEGAIGDEVYCSVNNSGYALPEFHWYPSTTVDDTFAFAITFQNFPADIRIYCNGEQEKQIEGGKESEPSIKWHSNEDVAGIWFAYGKYNETEKEAEGTKLIWANEKQGNADAEETLKDSANIVKYFKETIGFFPTSQLIFIESKMPEECFYIDDSGIIFIDTSRMAEKVPVDLLSYCISGQYFGVLVKENPMESGGALIADGAKRFLETLYLSIYEDEKAAIKRFGEMQALYAGLYNEAQSKAALVASREDSRFVRSFSEIRAAIILNMLRYNIGDDTKFFNALRKYIETRKNQAQDYDAFLKAFEDESGKNLTLFCKRFLKSGWDTWPPNYYLTFGEIRKEGDAWIIPITVKQNNGVDLPIKIAFRNAEKEERKRAEIIWTPAKDDSPEKLTEEFSFSIPFEPTEIILDPDNILLKEPTSKTRWTTEKKPSE